MTPNQRHQRRFVLYLLLISTAIFVLTMGEHMREKREKERERAAKLADQPKDYKNQDPKTYEKGGRTAIPRTLAQQVEKTPNPEEASPDKPDESVTDTSLQAGLPEPTEVLEGDALRQAIAQTMRDDVTEDILFCLEVWWMKDPGIQGVVELEYVIDEQGLREAFVVDHTDVPFGQLTCFATALYRTAWPASVEGEVVISQPIIFSPDETQEGSEPPQPSVVDGQGEELSSGEEEDLDAPGEGDSAD